MLRVESKPVGGAWSLGQAPLLENDNRMLTAETIDSLSEREPSALPARSPKIRDRTPALRSEPGRFASTAALDAEPSSPAPIETPKTVRGRRDHPARGDIFLYALFALLVAAAWYITELKLFKPSDDLSYWIAVVGGSMMLALFSYPLRKYVRFMQGLGKVKWWFWVHLFLGIAGPWLILVHSSFRIGSLNAGVALYSMGIVVASGVIGRFIFTRINRGLNGERMSLTELRERAGLVESDARSRLHFAPLVEARLLAFEERELHAEPDWMTHLRQVAGCRCSSGSRTATASPRCGCGCVIWPSA